MQEHDPANVEPFEFVLATAQSAGLEFTGSKTVNPAGSLPIFDRRSKRGTPAGLTLIHRLAGTTPTNT